MTEFRLLGPFEGPAELPGGKPRALLARLLLDPGRAVPADALIDALWERPPPSAPKVLQAHVSALRKALGTEAIETRGGGYAVLGATTDLQRFEELCDAHAWEAALELWRGEPLAEFKREPFAAPAAARLDELRLHALVRRVDADLELGRHEELAGELRALVDAEPLREPLRARLMLALYRSGRQVDALEAYREGRRLLVEELGIEPGRELQELERAILRQEPALGSAQSEERRGPVVCVGCAPLSLVAPLGREVLLVELTDDLGGAAARLGPLRGPTVRTAIFTSDDPGADTIRLAREQEAELLVVTTPLPGAPCDVAVLSGPAFEPNGPVLAPFGGGRDEWRALELAAWLARSHELPLRLVGVEATDVRRDASRTLAAASLALQRFAGIAPEPVMGDVLEQEGSAIVASLARGGGLQEHATIPVLLVRGGLRPSGLAPERSLTRFSWTAAPPQNPI